MGFDSRLGLAKVRPGKQAQAQIDGSRIHGKDRPLQPQANVFVAIQRQCRGDEPLPQCLEQSVVAALGRIGQGRARHAAANAHVIQLRPLCIQAGRQIAQARTARQLCVGQADEMAPRRKGRHPFVRLINIDQVLEVTDRNELQQLCENCPATIHDPASSAKKFANDSLGTIQNHNQISNRRNQNSCAIPCQNWLGAVSS